MPPAPATVSNGSTATSGGASDAAGATAARARHAHAPPPSTMRATTANASSAARRPRAGATGGTVCAPLVSDAASSAASISVADAGRCAGSFARHCLTSAASACGIDSGSGAGVSPKCAAMSCCGVVFPANGCCPASSSYATTPHAYRSARWSVAGSPAACSGRHVGRRAERDAELGQSFRRHGWPVGSLGRAPAATPWRCRSR